MKKSILIAVIAVIAATSGAKAEVNMDFDGKLGAQSMHDIFSAGHNIIPVPVSQTLAQPQKPAAQAVAGEIKIVRFMSYKVQRTQIGTLKNINARLIKNEKLAILLETQGTELWFHGNTINVINADIKGRFTIRDGDIFQAVYNAQSGNQRFDPVDLVVIGIVEVAHSITSGIQEYGSWPPVPDSGMANYDPVTGNDFSPGWGRNKKQ